MSSPAIRGPSQSDLDTALLPLSKFGVTPADLIAGAGMRQTVPTFAEFVRLVAEAITSGTRKAYASYWNPTIELWGDRRLDEPTPLEVEMMGRTIRAARIQRGSDRGGASSEEHFIVAVRCVYRRAIANGVVPDGCNPAAKVAKPRRQASNRHAIADNRLAEINRCASSGGDDPILDSLILRLHEETACRRGGAMNLRPMDLDQQQCLIRRREKGGTERWQPVSPTLMGHLTHHATERKAPNAGHLAQGSCRVTATGHRSAGVATTAYGDA